MEINKLKSEPLCSELKEWINEEVSQRFLNHPLLDGYTLSNPDEVNHENAYLNYQYRLKNYLFGFYLSESQYESMFKLVSKTAWMELVYKNRHLFLTKEGNNMYYEIVRYLYFNLSRVHFVKDIFNEILHFGGNSRLMMNPRETTKFQKLPESLKVFRGVDANDDLEVVNLIGSSWTLDYDKAVVYSKNGQFGNSVSPLVLGIEISKDDIMAYISQKKEWTILLDPNTLDYQNIELIYQ